MREMIWHVLEFEPDPSDFNASQLSTIPRKCRGYQLSSDSFTLNWLYEIAKYVHQMSELAVPRVLSMDYIESYALCARPFSAFAV